LHKEVAMKMSGLAITAALLVYGTGIVDAQATV
jgi:hypothetical protein